MTRKIKKNYIYNGLGFPVCLKEVEMTEVLGEWAPKINVKKIASMAIKKLALQEEKLTGNQVKFIRGYFSMSLREFGNTIVKQTHSAVRKWESFKDHPTSMDENTEDILKLYITDKLSLIKNPDKFRKQCQKLIKNRLKKIENPVITINQYLTVW